MEVSLPIDRVACQQLAGGGGASEGAAPLKAQKHFLHKASLREERPLVTQQSASIPMQGHECTFIYMHIYLLSNPIIFSINAWQIL